MILSVGLSVLAMVVYSRSKATKSSADSESSGAWFAWCSRACVWLSALLAIVSIGALLNNIFEESDELNQSDVQYRTRNSYGTLYVRAYYDDDGVEKSRNLVNGRIKHGSQFAYDPLLPSSYYSKTSGIGVAVDFLSEINGDSSLKFGVVGLGTGTMASWGIAGDSFKFYEINPACEYVAREYFAYLSGSEAADQIDVIIGDARIQMESHFAKHGSEEFDLLLVDAFSSDAIPMHLLTRACFKLYCDNISQTGILAVHVSNRYLDLDPIVYNLAKENDHRAFFIETDEDSLDEKMIEDFDNGADESSWVLVVKDLVLTQMIEDGANWSSWETPMPTTVWTDDFGSLTDVLDWSDTTYFVAEKWEELMGYFSSDD